MCRLLIGAADLTYDPRTPTVFTRMIARAFISILVFNRGRLFEAGRLIEEGVY